MNIATVEESRVGYILGKQIDPNALSKGELRLTDHLHVGFGPTPAWQYKVIQKTAEAAGVEHNSGFTIATCSDDANKDVRVDSELVEGAYVYARPGGQIDFGELEVGFHEGHVRNVILNLQHTGQYQTADQENVYFGKVAGNTDKKLRACCGMLDGVLKTLKTGQTVPVKSGLRDITHFIGLTEAAEKICGSYDLNDPARYSEAMWKFALEHMRAETRIALNGLVELNKNGHPKKFAVAEGIGINRFFKYHTSAVTLGIYIVDGTRVVDLSKESYPVKNEEAAVELAKVI